MGKEPDIGIEMDAAMEVAIAKEDETEKKEEEVIEVEVVEDKEEVEEETEEEVKEEKPKKKPAKKKPAKSKKKFQSELPAEVQLAMAALNKEFGDGSIMELGESITHVDIPGQIPTGSISLDKAIGVIRKQPNGFYRSGIPKGRVVEIYGPESSGKTTICNHIIAQAQKQNGICAFIDMEQAWDREYASRLGVQVDKLVVSQPDSGDQAMKTLELLIKTGKFAVIVVDSVAALVTQAELAGSITDNHMAQQARLMSQGLRIITPIVNTSSTTVIFTNQIREKVGIKFGNPEVTSGGNALKFYASLRIDIRKCGTIKKADEEIVGHKCKVKLVKNKIAPPFKVAEFDMLYGVGIDRFGEIVNYGVKYGIIEQKGSWYSIDGKPLGQGADNIKAYLSSEENRELLTSIYSQIMDNIAEELNG